MTAKPHKTRIGISIGDFNGIGPEIIIKTLKNKEILSFFTPIIFGSSKLFSHQRKVFKINQQYHAINTAEEAKTGEINLVNLHKEEITVNFGQPTETSTQLAIQSLTAATEALAKGLIDVLVTAPINKDEMLKHGFNYTGHTEYLEQYFKSEALMLMINEELRVAVSTHHIPLAEVATKITKERIVKQVRELSQCLQQDFWIEKPKIALLGLNPHAGDGGSIGKEEIDIINPAIRELFDEGILAFGPFPADSFFQPHKLKNYDAVFAMYHDQGLTPFKTLAYEHGVNFSANLTVVRTSPDHGVAYDIAGKNWADPTSFSEAIFSGIKIFKNRTEHLELLENQLQPQSLPKEKRKREH